MKGGIQRWRRWASNVTQWHWVAVLIGSILALSVLIAVTGKGPDERSSSNDTLNRLDMEPPATLRPVATSLPHSVQVLVVRVVDGVTVEVDSAVGRAAVRYIGVDAPETAPQGQAIGCLGREASIRNKELVEGRTVFLEKDVSETDQFGRLLRYVYLEDMQMVNELLIVEGFARFSSSPPDLKHEDRFMAAQQHARDAGRGRWGPPCQPTATPVTPRVVPTLPPTPTPPPSSENCSPAYPTVCIPPPPPDLDCRQIPFRRFQVLPPDPHRFDPESDGFGCEMR
jgi:micrococcal nuclease